MPEEIAATPGWVDEQLDEVFATLTQSSALRAARDAYASCLGASKSPTAPSDNLGAEFQPCRTALLASLREAHIAFDPDKLRQALEAVEADIVSSS